MGNPNISGMPHSQQQSYGQQQQQQGQQPMYNPDGTVAGQVKNTGFLKYVILTNIQEYLGVLGQNWIRAPLASRYPILVLILVLIRYF